MSRIRTDIVIGAGGTGGHLYPGIAVAKALVDMKKDMNIGFVITTKEAEMELMEKLGYKYWRTSASPLMGGLNIYLIKNAIMNLVSFFQSLILLVKSGTEMVIGMGGYLSGPLILASFFLNKRRVIFEQNIIPGITNRLLSHISDASFVSFAETKLSGEVEVIGNPIRDGLLRDRKESMGYFGLSPEKRTILIMGGSHGAHSINLAVMEALESGWGDVYQFLIQTGEDDYDEVLEIVKSAGVKAVVKEFFSEMGYYYGAGDIFVGRSGGGVFEVLNAGIPMILIPYPHSASNHQYSNASYIEKNGASFIIDDDKLNGTLLIEFIEKIMSDERMMSEMRKSSKNLAQPDSARIGAERVLEIMGGN